jgi:hypothetical protein
LRKWGITALLAAMVAAPLAHADEQEALKNLGVALGWRLAPETIEEFCRKIDPAGVTIRVDALRDWQKKNARQIQAVDDRVKEVVPLLKSAPANVDVAAAVSAQIRTLILEANFTDNDAEKTLAACKVEADPTRATWTSNGRPFVDEALAALYDWKVQQTAK